MKTHHHKRRTWSVHAPAAIAVLLLSYSALHGVPGAVAQGGIQMVANVVGASASVPVTPENTIATQLAQKETLLEVREERVLEREEALSLRERDLLPLASFIASIILSILVGLNFFFDYRRGKRVPRGGIVNLKQS